MSACKTIAILFGGQSAEHEVSIRSAACVLDALKTAGHSIVLIWIDRDGVWHQATRIGTDNTWPEVVMPPGAGGLIRDASSGKPVAQVDLVFPVLHGPQGEDGTVQGLLRLCRVPFIGCDVLASALCMDKSYTRRVLRAAGLPTARALSFTANEAVSYQLATRVLGEEMFIKPTNMGSSIGVSYANDPESFRTGLAHAFKFDKTAVVEQKVYGREIECAVICDPQPRASVPGEVSPPAQAGFYSYEEKYSDESSSVLSVPAQLQPQITRTLQSMAIAAAKVLNCEGLVRVDFFVGSDNAITINELNTMPGFTSISMFPRLWEASGMTTSQVVQCLIDQAMQRFDLLASKQAALLTEASQHSREVAR